MTAKLLTIYLTMLVPEQSFLADKAYDADRIRAPLREKGSFANIPPKANRKSKPYFSTARGT